MRLSLIAFKRDPMKHTRIRPFNTKVTYPEQNLDNDLCQAVVARGRMVFLAGRSGKTWIRPRAYVSGTSQDKPSKPWPISPC